MNWTALQWVLLLGYHFHVRECHHAQLCPIRNTCSITLATEGSGPFFWGLRWAGQSLEAICCNRVGSLNRARRPWHLTLACRIHPRSVGLLWEKQLPSLCWRKGNCYQCDSVRIGSGAPLPKVREIQGIKLTAGSTCQVEMNVTYDRCRSLKHGAEPNSCLGAHLRSFQGRFAGLFTESDVAVGCMAGR